MFHKLAEFYDGFVSSKDYRGEARRLELLVKKYGRAGDERWLDVACGTGRHLEILRRGRRVVGVDASGAMLRVARKRLPGVRLVRADMQSFRLGETFDVVTCLFSAIGHLRSERALVATFVNFARHLRPGGVVIVEPWLDPDTFHEGMVFLMTHQDPSATLVRVSHSRKRGNRSVLDCHYLVAEPGRGIRHYAETDIGLLVSRRRLIQLLREAGLRPRYLATGLRPGRGLLVAVRGED